MERAVVLLLFYVLLNSAKGQTIDEDWSPLTVETLDTLHLNNCPPEWLWSQWGFSKSQVYSFHAYRTAMRGIHDPLELYMLEHWDSISVEKLLSVLPLEEPHNKGGNTAIQHRFSARTSTKYSVLLHHTGPASFAFARSIEHEEGTKITHRQYGYFNSPISQNIFFGVGDFRLSSGQGLLHCSSSFASATTGEYFARGVRGQTGTYSGGSSRSAVFTYRGQPLSGYFSLDTSGTVRTALQYASNFGKIGMANTQKEWSIFANVYVGHLRSYAEWTTNAHKYGTNYWWNDVLLEWNHIRDHQGMRWEYYMSWRDAWGTWALRRTKRRLRLQWNNGDWHYWLNEHLVTNEASTWRHKVRYSQGPLQMDLHYHNGTKGWSVRWKGHFSHWTYSSQISMIQVDNSPIWLAVPASGGQFPAQGIYSNFAGTHLKVAWRGWQCAGSINFAQQPYTFGMAASFRPHAR